MLISGSIWVTDVSETISSRWATGRLLTAAYDGVVRRMDPQRGEFELLLARDDAEFSAFDCTLDGTVLFLGDNGGNFEMVDTREKSKESASVNLHDRKLNTLHVRPTLLPLLWHEARGSLAS